MSVALIAHSRIISNQWYVSCSLYQMCLVCDIHRQQKMQSSLIANKEGQGNKKSYQAYDYTIMKPRSWPTCWSSSDEN